MINPPPFRPSGKQAERGLWGRILLTVAVVWLVLTGGCTMALSITYVLGDTQTYGLSILVVFLIVGAVCMAPGLVLLAIALWLPRRRGRRSGG